MMMDKQPIYNEAILKPRDNMSALTMNVHEQFSNECKFYFDAPHRISGSRWSWYLNFNFPFMHFSCFVNLCI